MPYIGNDIQYGELNSQTFTGDGSTTAFTLTYTVSNVNSLLVTVADVIQEPTTAYTVSGTTLTFTSAPANLDTIHVRYLGRTLDVGTTAIVQDSDQDTLIQVEESADEDTIRFDTGGTERVTINSTSVTSTIPLYIPDGSAAAPSITNTGDTNTGIFFPAADTVGVAVGGTEVWRYGSNPTTAKNLIINGAMTVAQRGTLTGQGGADAYTALDRWLINSGSTVARVTTSQDTLSVANSVLAGGQRFALKVDCTTIDASIAAGDYLAVATRLEAQDLQHLQYGDAAAKTLTLSFGISSPKSGTHCVALFQTDANRHYIREFTVASADTFEVISVTFPGDASGQIDNDTGRGLDVVFPIVAGSSFQGTADAWAANTRWATSNQQNLLDNTANNIYITGVQLEVGSVATDFEHEDYGTTLAKCQRYLFGINNALDGDVNVAFGMANGATLMYCVVRLPNMRAVPTLTATATDWELRDLSGFNQALTAIDLNTSSENYITIQCTVASGLTQYRSYYLKADGTLTRTILISAEL
jgi:hypothetical protein